MKKLKQIILVVGIPFCSLCWAGPTETIELQLNKNDALSARQNLRLLGRQKISGPEWKDTREVLHNNPWVGWDVIKYWDTVAPTKLNKVDEYLAEADKNMLEKKFDLAFKQYQKVALMIKSKKNWKTGQNYKLYWTIIHSMGRALYGAKRFPEARKVYSTIPSSYELTRQVLFELMWTSYRENRMEYALGYLASQASGYFSNHLEPESYLLQYYIYKRMCRDEEAEKVVKNVKSFANDLKNGRFTMNRFLGKDVETLAYKNALEYGAQTSTERESISKYLQKRHKADEKRLLGQIEVVQAHLNVVQGRGKDLEPITSIQEVPELLKSTHEKWDAEDKEVWVDEVGRHVFVAENLCKK